MGINKFVPGFVKYLDIFNFRKNSNKEATKKIYGTDKDMWYHPKEFVNSHPYIQKNYDYGFKYISETIKTNKSMTMKLKKENKNDPITTKPRRSKLKGKELSRALKITGASLILSMSTVTAYYLSEGLYDEAMIPETLLAIGVACLLGPTILDGYEYITRKKK